jgi:hypothetical protein
MSSLVAAVTAASIGAAASLPLAERAAKAGQWAKALGLVVFFLLMVGVSLTASIARVGGKHDSEVSAVRVENARISLAHEAYETAQRSAEAECATGRGPRCRAAEHTIVEARKALQSAPIKKVDDSMARRIAAVLPVTEQQVQLYQPLLLPFALQLGGFVLLALGLAPAGQIPPARNIGAPEKTISTNMKGEEAALHWVVQQVFASPGRRLTASGRELAAATGVAPSTFALWMARWVSNGKLVAERSGNKTIYSLPIVRRIA